MRTAIFTAALAASTVLAVPAFAQDSDRSFTGPRAEGVVGWDRIEDGTGVDGDARDGVVYGGALGYDYDLGTVVIGAEAELTGSTTKGTENSVLENNDALSVRAGRDIYVGGRVGFKAGPTLIYAKGGYTNGRINANYKDAAGVVTEAHENLDGWRLGAGVEVPVSGNIYLKGEYRYSNYNHIDDFDIDANVDRHQVVGGVGIRF